MVKIRKFLKPYSWKIALVIGLVSIQAILTLYLPDLMSNIVNRGVVRGDTDYIVREGLWMLLVSVVGMVSSVLATLYSARVSADFGGDLRNAIFRKALNLSIAELENFGTSSMVTRTTNDVMQLQQTTFMVLRMVVMAPIMGIGGSVMAFSKDSKLSMVLLISVPALTGGIYLIVRFVTPLFRNMQKKIDVLNRVVRETVTGVRVIRAFNRDEDWKRRFDEVNEDLARIALKVSRIGAMVFPLLTLVMNFTIVAVIWIGAKRIDIGSLQIGDMMAVMQYVLQILFSFMMISVIFLFLPRAQVAAERIERVLNTRPMVEDSDDSRELKIERGKVEFKNVTFRFPGAPEPVLKNISFTANPGEVTAVVGNTGAGKSTLLNLIMRFYDVESGCVCIDGMDVRSFKLESLRKQIGYATQKAVIFKGTIRENIRFGRDIPDDRVEKAAEVAQVMEFASKMEGGLDGEISEGGTNLSGGQKQRISITRAIAKDCRIYLFDDTFSALDFRTDAKIRNKLSELTKDSTVIVVAQRVATVMNADKIVVLKDGRVEGIGTHEQLYRTCPVYRDMVLSQLSEEEAQPV